MTRQMIRIATALALAGAVTLAAAGPSCARGHHVVARIAKAPADARGYFYVPPNYVDDGYVYDPAASHRDAAGARTRHRHRGG